MKNAGAGESPSNDVPVVERVSTRRKGDLTRNSPSSSCAEKSYQTSNERWVRTIACLYFEVSGPEPKSQEWRLGPLPVSLPNGHQADREARATYFHARAAESLYGPSDGSSATRWYRTSEDWPKQAGLVHGVELLSFPRYASALGTHSGEQSHDAQASRFLAVIHLSLSADHPLSELASAVRLDPMDNAGAARRQFYAELIGPGFQISPQVQRAFSVVMFTWRGQLRSPERTPPEWSPITSWLWCAASATPLREFLPDSEDPHLLDGMVYLSSSWRALVLRDGISFIGLTEDNQVDGKGFFTWGEAYVRSLYTDVALLATLERDALDDFAERLARIGDRFEKSLEFRSLVNEVTEFRNVFWWEHVTRHGTANDILRHLHGIHRTPQVFTRVISDLDAFRQQVEGQALEASLRSQVTEERRARTFEHAASIAAIAFGLPVLIFAALAVPIRGVTSDGRDLSGWVIIVIALSSILIGAMAGAIGSWWLSRRKL